MLEIKDLKVKIQEDSGQSTQVNQGENFQKEILKGINLKVEDNKVHVLMGPNGSGKSTLAQAIMGHPAYDVTSGQVSFNGEPILDLDVTQRANVGIFLSFQYPSEITGVTISSFLRLIYNKAHNTKLSPAKFRKILKEKMSLLEIDDSFANRYLNEGFSGGEKKRMEMLQMLVLEPKLAILDETDSGLDIDALKTVANAVNALKKETKMSVLLITHYTRILNYIDADKVHIMQNGKIVKEGNKSLADELEKQGFAPFED